MPQSGQVSVTIPEEIWEQVKAYYEENVVCLRKRGIKSPSKLIAVLIEKGIKESTHFV